MCQKVTGHPGSKCTKETLDIESQRAKELLNNEKRDLPIEVSLAEAVPAPGLVAVGLSVQTLVIEAICGDAILGSCVCK
jgi:hypothetical protein